MKTASSCCVADERSCENKDESVAHMVSGVLIMIVERSSARGRVIGGAVGFILKGGLDFHAQDNVKNLCTRKCK